MTQRSIIGFLILTILCPAIGNAADIKKPFTIGYFEAGPYFLHRVISDALRKDLASLTGDSSAIEYSPHAYYSAAWDRMLCKRMAGDLARSKEVDLVMAAGPWVVEDLIAAGFNKPIVGIYQFDPEVMGLVDSAGKPVVKNLTVSYDPNKIQTDMAALQKLFPSEKIGLLYFPSGDEFEKMRDKVYQAAGAYGAVIYSAREFGADSTYSFFFSFEKIRKNIRVLYLPPLFGLELDIMRQFLIQIQNARIPTFVSEGYLLLEKGASGSNCRWPYLSLARFSAEKIIKIQKGAEPASLPTRFDEIEGLCINLDITNKLGITFSRDIINEAKVIPILSADTTTNYTLTQAIEQALRENAGFLASEKTYDKAIAEARAAYRTYYPQINFELSSAAADNGRKAALYDPILNNKFKASIIADQTIFSFPAIKAIQAARKNMALEKLDRHQEEMNLKQAVIEAYLSVLENEDRADTQNEAIDRLQKLHDNVETNVRLGHGEGNETALVEERLIEARIKLYNIENDLHISRVIFNTLLNRPGDYIFTLDRTEFTPDIMVAMVKKLDEYIINSKKQRLWESYLIAAGIRNSTQMSMMDMAIGIQSDLLAAHKGRYLPELALRAGYSYGKEFSPAVSDREDYWVVGGLLRLPLFPGNRQTYNAGSLKAGLEELQYRKDDIRFQKMQEIMNRVSTLAASITTLPLNYSLRNLSGGNYDSALDRYNSGKGSVIDLIPIEERSAERMLDAVADQYRFFRAYVDLLNSVGVGYMLHGSPEESTFYKSLESYLGN
jgi:outer membrane protein TolC/ABC-type uncharacterized transport system substrate-binding protein